MTRHKIITPVSRRRRPRTASINIKFDQLMRHAHPSQTNQVVRSRDDWAMEWLYDDFSLWGQIKLDTAALSQMMHESELLTQFNADTNRCRMTISTESEPLSYLVKLMNRHQSKNRK